MSHRYRFLARLVSEEAGGGSRWLIEGDEAFHLRKVLRLSVGDAVELCDGAGLSAFGSISQLSKEAVTADAGTPLRSASSSSPLILMVGALKPRSVDEILPALVELGVDELHLFLSPEVARHRLDALERWQRIALAAVKQCKRPFLPKLETWPNLAACLAALRTPSAGLRLFASGAAKCSSFQLKPASGPLMAVVGGEKGLSAAEEDLLCREGYTGANLGPYVLRATTAALAVAATLIQRRAEPDSP